MKWAPLFRPQSVEIKIVLSESARLVVCSVLPVALLQLFLIHLNRKEPGTHRSLLAPFWFVFLSICFFAQTRLSVKPGL